jgi:sugar lactone lactonase YvrE
MFPSAFFSTAVLDSVFPQVSLRLRGLKMACVVGATALALLAGGPLVAQTAHFSGAVITLGSGFSSPQGVAVDGNGNVFVTDSSSGAVKEIVAVNGRIPASPTIRTLGSGFSYPTGVAVDASGNVFVSDTNINGIKEMLAVNGSIPDSPTIKTLGTGGSSTFDDPSGLTLDKSGNVYAAVYVSSNHSRAVFETTAASGYTTVTTSGSNTMYASSNDGDAFAVAVDGSGNVFVATSYEGYVQEIVATNGTTSPSSSITTLALGFGDLTGVAVDSSGNVFVTDAGSDEVEEIEAVGGSIPSSPVVKSLGGGFSKPEGVAVDGNGNLFVGDSWANAVKEIQTAGGAFGPVNVGAESAAPIAITFTFDTAGTLGSTAVLTQGATGLDFTDAGGGSCTANTAYNAGDTCTVNVTFKPRYPGPRYGAVELLSTSGALVATGYLQGTGVGPQAVFANSTTGSYLASAQSNIGSGFVGPFGVAVDGNGNVYVADTNGGKVYELEAVNGIIPASPTSRTLGTFANPSSVAVDGAGNVLVADYGHNAVKQIVAVNGSIPASPTIRTLGSGFDQPMSVATDGYGNVFVSDEVSASIKEILVTGGYVTVNTLASGFNLAAIAVDGEGNVYVADFTNHAVKEIMAVGGRIPSSPTIKTLSNGFIYPQGVAVDGEGNVIVADYGRGLTEIVAMGGSIPSSPTLNTLSSGCGAIGVVVDAKGNVFFTCDLSDVTGSVTELDFADPPSLSFASTHVGMLSSDSPKTVTVSNDGNAALTFPVPTTGDNPSLASSFLLNSASTCEQTSSSSSAAYSLAAGESCTLAIDFEPVASGSITGGAVLTDNSLNVAGAMQTIPLSGTGAGPLAFSAKSLSFGSVDVGISSALQSVTMTNTGTAVVSITSIALTGTNASQFVSSNTCGTSLAVGANCTIHARFAPTATGAMTAAVTITDSASDSPQSISLSGTGVQPAVGLSASSLTFGATNVGSSSAMQSVTLTNTGNGPLSITGIAVTGTNAVAFVFTNNCGTSVAPGASCAIQGHFAPTATGAMAAAVTITDNASGSPQSIELSGTGVAPVVSLSAGSIAFGSADIGKWSALHQVTMTNTGTGPLLITSIAVTGADASEFVFANSCGTSLASGANCVIHGHMQPTKAGAFTAAVTITDNAANSPQSISLSGTGVQPTAPVTLSATRLSYPSTLVGATSDPQAVTVTNTGSATVSITSIALTGVDASSFVFLNTCGTSLAVGANCTIHGHFAPMAGGALTATITITDSASNSPQTIALSGTGLAPVVSLSSNSFSFGTVNVGSISTSQSAAVTNTGTAALTISSVAVTGTNASSFVFANNCGPSLAVGASCTIHGHFAPTVAGAATAAVTIADNAAGSPQSIALSGTGN